MIPSWPSWPSCPSSLSLLSSSRFSSSSSSSSNPFLFWPRRSSDDEDEDEADDDTSLVPRSSRRCSRRFCCSRRVRGRLRVACASANARLGLRFGGSCDGAGGSRGPATWELASATTLAVLGGLVAIESGLAGMTSAAVEVDTGAAASGIRFRRLLIIAARAASAAGNGILLFVGFVGLVSNGALTLLLIPSPLRTAVAVGIALLMLLLFPLRVELASGLRLSMCGTVNVRGGGGRMWFLSESREPVTPASPGIRLMADFLGESGPLFPVLPLCPLPARLL